MPKQYKNEFQKMYDKIDRFDKETGTYKEDPEEDAEKKAKAAIPGFKGFLIRNWGYLLGLLGVLVVFILYLTVGRSMFLDLSFWDGLVSFIGVIWVYVLAAVVIVVVIWYYLKYGRYEKGNTFKW